VKIVFMPQFKSLLEWLGGQVSERVTESVGYLIADCPVADGKARLADRSMNAVALAGGSVVLRVPDVVPGKARDFLARLVASADTDISVEGAEAVESDNPDVLGTVSAGETVLLYFTETAAGVFAVSRKAVERITI
jgi:hypothetical protein